MYPYNPLKEYNADGLELPIFHCAERFESRFFMQYLMDLEEKSNKATILKEYYEEKKSVLKYYTKKLNWLNENNADYMIKKWVEDFINKLEISISNIDRLTDLYNIESFRSYVIDVHDDIGGQSCTPETLKKIEKVIAFIDNNYELLHDNKSFFWGDEKLNKQELYNKYISYQTVGENYQVKNKKHSI